MIEETVKVSLYMKSVFLKPYLGYTTLSDPKTINILAFLKRKAVENMLKDPKCFYKAIKAIWKKKNMKKVFGYE